MNRAFIIILVLLLSLQAGAQSIYQTKNRNTPITLDTSIDGVWAGGDSVGHNVADSAYLFYAGIPDWGDLTVPDAELKVKTLWYGSKVYFLLRRLDDKLIGDNITSDSVKYGVENLDATALYFFMDTIITDIDSITGQRVRYDTLNNINDLEHPMYTDGYYSDSISWFRFGWNSDEFEGAIGSDTADPEITSIADLGGDMIQWQAGDYYYIKLMIDMSVMAQRYYPEGDSMGVKYPLLDSIYIGFDIEMNENDKENFVDGFYEQQTRAFLGGDYDSSATSPRNLSRWTWLYFTYGASYDGPVDVSFTEYQIAKIYPNPVSDYLTISLINNQPAHYSLYNIMGQLISYGDINASGEQIEVGMLEPGTYFIRLQQGEGKNTTQKIFITR